MKPIQPILDKKKRGEKIVMLTAYDYPTGAILDECGIDIVLVGDSLANVVLGLGATREVGMEVMLHHTRAVRRGVKNALLIGDMPYEGYQADPSQAVKNARRFMDEAGCDAVKIEWFDQGAEVSEAIVKAGIPVMGHVGLTPQTVDPAVGFKVRGRDAESAQAILKAAKIMEEKGCFSVVLECVPDKVAGLITRQLKVPTIGIGAGPNCDGQVLVIHDLIGLSKGFHPKFAKQYVNISDLITRAVRQYRDEVVSGKFPDKFHSFSIPEEEIKKLKG